MLLRSEKVEGLWGVRVVLGAVRGLGGMIGVGKWEWKERWGKGEGVVEGEVWEG